MQNLQVEVNAVVHSASVGATATDAAWQQATCSLRSMQLSEIPVNAICQNAAITSCASASQWLSSGHLFSSFVGRPTVVSYTALMTVFGELHGRWARSLFLLSDLGVRGLRSDTLCMASVTAPWERAELALKLWKSSESSQSPKRIAVERYCKNWKWEHVLSLMLQCSVETSTFANAMNACGISGQWRFSLHLLDEMSFLSVQCTAQSCSAAMNACRSRWEWVLHLLVAMKTRSADFDATSYSTFINAFERGSRWPFALELFSLAQAMTKLDTVTYNCALSTLKGSQWQKTFSKVSEMRECTLQPDDITYNVVISACEDCEDCGAERWEIAVAAVAFATAHGMQQDEVTCNTVISCLDTSIDIGLKWPFALYSAAHMTSITLSPSSLTLDTVAHAVRKEWKIAILQLQRSSW